LFDGGMASCPAPVLFCHYLLRKRWERVLENVKFSDSADLSDRQNPHCLGSVILAPGRDRPEIPQAPQPGTPTPGYTFEPISTKTESDAIAGMFMSIFEGELGDS